MSPLTNPDENAEVGDMSPGMGHETPGMNVSTPTPATEGIDFQPNINQPLFHDYEEEEIDDMHDNAREQAAADNTQLPDEGQSDSECTPSVHPTVEEQFQQAARRGENEATRSPPSIRRSSRLNKARHYSPIYQSLCYLVNDMSIESLFLMYEGLVNELECLLTEQISAKKGLKVFGNRELVNLNLERKRQNNFI